MSTLREGQFGVNTEYELGSTTAESVSSRRPECRATARSMGGDIVTVTPPLRLCREDRPAAASKCTRMLLWLAASTEPFTPSNTTPAPAAVARASTHNTN